MRRVVVILGVLALALVALVTTGAFRADSSSPAADAGTAPGATDQAAVPPARDALVLGAQAGDLAVGLAVTAEGGGLSLEATILGQDGLPANDLEVVLAAGSREQTATSCGEGCYEASLPVSLPAAVEARIGEDGARTARFDVPARWKPAPALVRRATDTYRSLRSVVFDEHLESRPGTAIDTRWVEEAPDRLSFRIAGGNEGIVIGARRWDREPGAQWLESPQDRLSLPEPVWGRTFRNASLLGSAEVRGRPVWIVSFRTDHGLPTWFTVWIDKETARPLELRMTTAAHFMVQRFVSFDGPASIEPPS
jgi:hypothetical protein